jgi:hypothetical protein
VDRSVFDDLRWRLQEADFRSLERFAQATESADADLRGCVQTYILELFDHIASALLENVAGLSDVSHYNTSLNDWCVEVLPEYVHDFRAG